MFPWPLNFEDFHSHSFVDELVVLQLLPKLNEDHQYTMKYKHLFYEEGA